MGFLDRLLGAPTLESVARDVTRELRAMAVESLKVDLSLAEITFRLRGGEMRLYLGNLLQDLQNTPRRDRHATLLRFLDGTLSPELEIPAAYADARASLIPVVRTAADIGIIALCMPDGANDVADQLPVTQRLTDELVIAIVHDRPTSMGYITGKQFATWAKTFDEMLADALDNLRGLPEHEGWTQIGPVWSGAWGDSYGSSRLLLPDLIHRVGIRDPVAAVPFRDSLLITGAGNEAGLALMAKLVEEHSESNQRWLSFKPLRLDGKTWHVFEPQGSAAHWHRLRLRNEGGTYQAQKELLDARHQRTDTDIFVATYSMASKDGGEPFSYAVWADDVDTLLPRTELIAFAWTLPDDTNGSLLVPWDDAVRVVGHLMEPTSESPERWRLRAFPDAPQRETLAGLVTKR